MGQCRNEHEIQRGGERVRACFTALVECVSLCASSRVCRRRINSLVFFLSFFFFLSCCKVSKNPPPPPVSLFFKALQDLLVSDNRVSAAAADQAPPPWLGWGGGLGATGQKHKHAGTNWPLHVRIHVCVSASRHRIHIRMHVRTPCRRRLRKSALVSA